MAISTIVLRKYLARPMRNSGAAKKLSEKKLNKLLNSQELEFETTPRHAQKVCTLLGWKYPGYAFLLGMGGGKTKIILDLFWNRRRTGEAKRLLVLVPNVVNLWAWEEEVRKHAPDVSVAVLDAVGSEARWSQMESSAEVVIATYAGFGRLLSKVVKNKKKSKNEMKPVPKLVDRLAKQFEMMALDESTEVKNHQTIWFRQIRRMRKRVKFCYALTGTPFDKNPIDLWSQFFLVDGGYALGETLGVFREAFFKWIPGHFGGGEWVLKKSKRAELAKRMAHSSIRYSEAECQDLPPSVGGIAGKDWMLRNFKLSPSQRPYYETLSEKLKNSHGNRELIDSAYTRMRMVSSGWLGARTPKGEKVELVFPENPKFDAAIALLREIPEGEKVMVIAWFNTTCKLFMERLKKEKIKAVLINGKVSTKGKAKALKSFESKKGARVMVGSTALSKGVNLQGAARYMVFLESMDSTIERSQIEARIRREGGLDGTRYFYDLIMRRGVGWDILTSLRTGRKLHEVLVDGK